MTEWPAPRFCVSSPPFGVLIRMPDPECSSTTLYVPSPVVDEGDLVRAGCEELNSLARRVRDERERAAEVAEHGSVREPVRAVDDGPRDPRPLDPAERARR
jgi:hypothetical protein